MRIKRKIRHLHVVVVQKWQRNAKIKAWCTCKVVVLLIKPIVLLKFSLPALSMDIRSHHVDAHARGKSKRLLAVVSFPREAWCPALRKHCSQGTLTVDLRPKLSESFTQFSRLGLSSFSVRVRSGNEITLWNVKNETKNWQISLTSYSRHWSNACECDFLRCLLRQQGPGIRPEVSLCLHIWCPLSPNLLHYLAFEKPYKSKTPSEMYFPWRDWTP